MKIKIITIGKNKEAWLQDGLEEYEKRLSPFCRIEWLIVKDDSQLREACQKMGKYIVLDPQGKSMSSEKFSSWLEKTAETLGSRMSFVIGGDKGLPAPLKAQALFLWSLSELTFTHQMTRLILLEQLYRAHEISRGSRYHK